MLHSVEDHVDVERFRKEGRILASVSHPNVIQIYRLGFYRAIPFIVMEFVPGEPFHQLLEGPRLPLSRVLALMNQVAMGLQAIHAKGLVHRDLSPKNIMTTASDLVKVLDLGLAKNIDALKDPSRGPYLVGTRAYISPEQIDGRPASFRSDVFAFGTLLYHALTGVHPFYAEFDMSLLYNIAHKGPQPLEQLRPGMPATIQDLVSRCLIKDPMSRLQDITQAVQTLTTLLADPDLRDDRPADDEKGASRIHVTASNPYFNRTMIRRWDDFFGREHEVRRIYARLNASPPGSVSIVGDLKIGKSSLLNYIYMKRNRDHFLHDPEQMIMVFMDLREKEGMSREVFVKILIQMAELELRGEVILSDCTYDLDGIKTLVERLHERGLRLTMLFDEFDAVTRNPNFDLEFFSFLRFLANHYDVAYITSSERNLQILCHTKAISDSPFFNIFSTMRLSVLRQEEAEILIRVPSERFGFALSPYAKEIVELAGLFPFFLQMACSHATDYLSENPDRSEPDFAEIHRRFYEEAKFHFGFTWSRLDDHERSVLKRVATRKRIPEALQHVLQELESRHLLETYQGSAQLFSPTFAEYVRGESSSARPSGIKGLLRRG
jgi:hypothetical protein